MSMVENSLIICKSSGLSTVNGRRHGDLNGSHTRVHTTGNSVVDYVVVPAEQFTNIKSFTVGERMPEPDHRPLIYTIELPKIKMSIGNHCNEKRTYYKWDKNHKMDFIHMLNNNIGMAFRGNFVDKLACMESVEVIADSLAAYLRQVLDKTMKVKTKRKEVYPHNVWYDDDCKKLRKVFKETDVETQRLVQREVQ